MAQHFWHVSVGNKPVGVPQHLLLAHSSSLTGHSMVVATQGGTDPSVPFFRLPAPVHSVGVWICVFAFDGV